jgi:hypothetical protein
MPTVITKTIKGSGGDYTSLAAAIAGTAGNLVSLDQQVNIACYASATADQSTGSATVSGYTTDATRYVKIYTPSTERHPGWWSGTFYYFGTYTNTGDGLTVATNYTVIDGIAAISSDSVTALIKVTASNCTLSNCLSVCDEGGYCYRFTNNPNLVYNCVASSADTAVGIYDGSGTGITLDNCTSHTTSYSGVYGGICTNCLSYSASNQGFYSPKAGSDYNATNFSTATGGAHDRVSQTFTFVGASKYQLAVGDTGAKGYGSNLSGTFTTDIAGSTRSVPWDIGAWMAQAGSYSYTGSGSIAITGAATTSEISTIWVGSGSLAISGAATTAFGLSYAGAGSVAISGTATVQRGYTYAGSGSVAIAGSATKLFGLSYSGAGSVSIVGTGTATATGTCAYVGGGSLAITGTATKAFVLSYTGSGSVAITGTATKVFGVSYTASGTVAISGSAANTGTAFWTYPASARRRAAAEKRADTIAWKKMQARPKSEPDIRLNRDVVAHPFTTPWRLFFAWIGRLLRR